VSWSLGFSRRFGRDKEVKDRLKPRLQRVASDSHCRIVLAMAIAVEGIGVPHALGFFTCDFGEVFGSAGPRPITPFADITMLYGVVVNVV